MYWDELKNLILSTEHGPMGGDEINKIKITEKKIINYGWPIASYGEHYRNTPLNYYIHKNLYFETIFYGSLFYFKYSNVQNLICLLFFTKIFRSASRV